MLLALIFLLHKILVSIKKGKLVCRCVCGSMDGSQPYMGTYQSYIARQSRRICSLWLDFFLSFFHPVNPLPLPNPLGIISQLRQEQQDAEKRETTLPFAKAASRAAKPKPLFSFFLFLGGPKLSSSLSNLPSSELQRGIKKEAHKNF